MRWLVLLVLNSACVGTMRRDEVRLRVVREHYVAHGFGTSREAFVQLWEARDQVIALGCARLDEPCRRPAVHPNEYCFAWGEERACFTVDERNGRTSIVRTDTAEARTTERWLYARLDPKFETVDEAASEVAELEVQKEEVPPVDANSFWLTTRAVVQVPAVSLGLQVQGGYRRWLEHYLLFSVGGGYERTFASTADSLLSRDALLFTARLELSAYWPGTEKRLNLPGIGCYVGLTGVLGVAPTQGWTTRAFVGVTSVVPISIELGYAVSSAGSLSSISNFYVAAGLGI